MVKEDMIYARYMNLKNKKLFKHVLIKTPANKSKKINFIGGHTLLNQCCRTFYILGGDFFYFDEIAKVRLQKLKNMFFF